MKPRTLLFITVFNSILGLSVLFPVLPPLGRHLGLTELQIGSLSTSYALMQFLVSPFWGRRSERVGRKPILVTGILGFSLSFLGFAVVAQLGLSGVLGVWGVYGLLLAARIFGGTFSSATLPTAQAYIADTTGREDRTAGMALIGAAFGLGIVFGPAIGAGLATISLLAPVYFSAAFALLNGIFVMALVPEPKRHVAQAPPKRASSVATRVWPLLFVGLAVSLASVAMEQTIAFYYQDRLQLLPEQTARTVGIALVCYGVVAVFVQGFLVRRAGLAPLSLLRFGVPIALVGFVFLVFAHQFATLTVALAIQGFGQGLALPGVSAALSLAVADNEQGAVAGLNSSATALGRMLGPVVGTSLYQLHPEYPYGFSAILLVLVIVFLIAYRQAPALRNQTTETQS
ncbi:MAG: MFS transporter [Myxococcales bacterium]|nr:MFS transporter [Myxococcales bacterium]MCB9578412.1 MFS transporter [Polyangiaceae bacterium]